MSQKSASWQGEAQGGNGNDNDSRLVSRRLPDVGGFHGKVPTRTNDAQRSPKSSSQLGSPWSRDHEDGGPTIQLPAASVRCTLPRRWLSVYAFANLVRIDWHSLQMVATTPILFRLNAAANCWVPKAATSPMKRSKQVVIKPIAGTSTDRHVPRSATARTSTRGRHQLPVRSRFCSKKEVL